MKIQIPENWSDITLKQFQTYHVEMQKDINQTTRLIQTISSFCNVNFSDAVRMKIKDIKDIALQINDLLQIVPNQLVMIFELNGVKYGFIPKLDDITIGEYADLEHYLSDTENMWNNMHNVMAILYREVKEEKDGNYLIEEYTPSNERSELFKSLTMNVVYSASNFFLTLGQELLETMPSYLEEGDKKPMKEILKKMQTDGDGLELYTTSQEEILQNLMKLKNKN